MEEETSQGRTGRRRRYDVGMPKSKAYSNPLPAMADEVRYSNKCLELRAKIREIERENQNIQLKIHQSKKNISRLRIERSILYDSLGNATTAAAQAADLSIPSQAQSSRSNQPLPSTSLSNPSTSIPSTHNGYHPQNATSNSDRPFNDTPVPLNNHPQPPNRNSNRSTEPIVSNGITGLLNSTHSNSHHAPSSAATAPPPIPHSQYPSTLPIQSQVPHDLTIPPPHRRTPVNNYSPVTTHSPNTSSSNHFPHHQMGARAMSISSHHPSHNRYPSPHHSHRHHHHHHVEHSHSNPGSGAVLPSLHSHHSSGSHTLSNGNGASSRQEGSRIEGEGEEEEVEDDGEEDDDDEEEEEMEEVDGNPKAGSTSMRIVGDEMEVDAEGDEDD